MPWWESNPKLAEIAKFSVIEDLTITAKEIGRGSYGTVYAAVHSSKPCVAKEMHPFLRHDKLESFVKEINILSALKHPSIVQFLGVYFRDASRPPILVMELMWKNLHSLLEEQPNKLFLLTKAHILYDVACGLQYLHTRKKPVIHRDLHPSNILLNENLNAKIADLGQATLASSYKLTSAPGNLIYMAPETLQRKPTYDTKLDVFSLGCTIIHLVTEKCPGPSDRFVETEKCKGTFLQVSEANRRIEFLKLMAHVPVLKQLAYQCLEDAPTNRPTAGDICSELAKYIHRLELEAPELAKQHNKDKFSILQLLEEKEKLIEDINTDKSMLYDIIAKKEEHISSLESQYQDCKNKFDTSEFTICSLKQDKESLLKELEEIKLQMQKETEITTTYKSQVNQLNLKFKAKEEEVKHLTIDIEGYKLKLSKLEAEVINLQDDVKEKQEEFNKGARKIKLLEQTVNNSTTNEVFKCVYA